VEVEKTLTCHAAAGRVILHSSSTEKGGGERGEGRDQCGATSVCILQEKHPTPVYSWKCLLAFAKAIPPHTGDGIMLRQHDTCTTAAHSVSPC